MKFRGLLARMEALESRRLLDADPGFLLTLGSREQDAGEAVATDADGNVIIAGSFERAINFDPVRIQVLDSGGGNDAYIAKYSADGQLRWAHRIGSDNFDASKDIAADASGNVYVVGEFQGRVDFDPSSKRAILTSTKNAEGSFTQDIFVLKFNANGKFQWVRQIGGRGFDEARAVAIDESGVYLTGSFARRVDFDPGGGKVRREADGDNDAFVLKLSKGGDYGYSRRLGAADTDVGIGIAVDRNRQAYVTGQSNAAEGDAFIAMIDRQGRAEWFRRIGGVGRSTAGRDIAVASNGDVLTIGAFQGIADFDPSREEHYINSSGPTDTFITRLDSRGRLIWAKGIGGDGIGNGVGIAVDDRNAIHVTGTFTGTADFDPRGQTFELTSRGDEDVYVAKYNKNGRLLAATSFGGDRQDTVTSLCLGDGDSVHVTGFFKSHVDFDPGKGKADRRSRGDFDLFVVEYAL